MRLRPAGVRAASALGIASENQPRRFRSRVQGGSFDCAPGHGKATHDGVDTIDGLMLSLIGEMGVANGGQNGLMAQDTFESQSNPHRLQSDAWHSCGAGSAVNSFF